MARIAPVSYRRVRLPPLGARCRVADSQPATIEATRQSEDGRHLLLLRWDDGRSAWHALDQVAPALLVGMSVQDVPGTRPRASLGVGSVVQQRYLGERHQVLVDFPERGDRLWLPWEQLLPVAGPFEQFSHLEPSTDHNAAERLRLRCLAWAIETWNENTGAFSRLDIDPLPHQVHLVHTILASGNLNWLIADDVGLGKTIEVGMLIAALSQRGLARRVLIVSPAGLMRQWQEELELKFGMADFRIQGWDFHARTAEQWRDFDHVIASLDRIKADEHLENLMASGRWDLIVFDEAHRLGRREYGLQFKSTQRYRLAAHLRTMTDALILLTATPHQGRPNAFRSLLELVRPDLEEDIARLSVRPQVLREMVIRNHKPDVIDQDGRRVFRGKHTRAVQVDLTEEEVLFDDAIRRFVRDQYRQAEALKQSSDQRERARGRAVGFVATVYRKLHASSVAAIHRALTRRRERLAAAQTDDVLMDERYSGEAEEAQLTIEEQVVGIDPGLDALIHRAAALLQSDTKLRVFMDEVAAPLLAAEPVKKLLVFSEYRATQDHLAEAIAARWGEGSVVQINGSMTWKERSRAIEAFESSASILVSTEAGGEGLNLHRQCHILVNYDLPWNPMRLVQRVGRLYRYGQLATVVVMNLVAPRAFDAKVLSLLYTRIDQVARDLATIDREFAPGLEDEIVGQLAENLDVEQILEEAAVVGARLVEEKLVGALDRAKAAVSKQQELFAWATSFDASDLEGGLRVDLVHLRSFVLGMCRELGIDVTRKARSTGEVFELALTEQAKEAVGSRGQTIRVTFERHLAALDERLEMVDFSSKFLRWLLGAAREIDFGGESAVVGGVSWTAMLACVLRWQDDRGKRLRRELVAFTVDASGEAYTNSAALSAWLAGDTAIRGAGTRADNLTSQAVAQSVRVASDRRLAAVAAGSHLQPENRQIIAAAWGGNHSALD